MCVVAQDKSQTDSVKVTIPMKFITQRHAEATAVQTPSLYSWPLLKKKVQHMTCHTEKFNFRNTRHGHEEKNSVICHDDKAFR